MLSDPEKRRAYDRFGFEGVGAGGPGGFPGGLRRVRRPVQRPLRRPVRRADGRAPAAAAASAAPTSATRTRSSCARCSPASRRRSRSRSMMRCETCSGSGARPGTEPETLRALRRQRADRSSSRACSGSAGRATRAAARAAWCASPARAAAARGASRASAAQGAHPAGRRGRHAAARRGRGRGGHRGRAGRRPLRRDPRRAPPLFEREGATCSARCPSPSCRRRSAREIEVPTLEGKVTLRISEGTQSGKMLRLRGKGLPSVARQRARRPAGAALRRGAEPADEEPARAARAVRRGEQHGGVARDEGLPRQAPGPVRLRARRLRGAALALLLAWPACAGGPGGVSSRGEDQREWSEAMRARERRPEARRRGARAPSCASTRRASSPTTPGCAWRS